MIRPDRYSPGPPCSLPPTERTAPTMKKTDRHMEDAQVARLWRYGLNLYRTAWEAYRKAGCPFGEHDEAMLIWFTFDQHTREN